MIQERKGLPPAKDGETKNGWRWDQKTNEWRRQGSQTPFLASAGVLALERLGGRVFEVLPPGAKLAVLITAAVVAAAVLTYHFAKGGDQNVLPTWAEGEKALPGESGKDVAKRLCDARYGPGNYKRGPDSEYSKIKKVFDRGGGS